MQYLHVYPHSYRQIYEFFKEIPLTV